MPSALIGRSGEDVEAVVSMLLCRRYVRAARRRAGQGDRGVDVMVPADDGRLDVYQVKRYDRPLTASQWAKIRESYKTLARACGEGTLTVRNWYLALPLDQSESDEVKFAEMTAGSLFERCEWRGLAWLDALAAEFPDVIDYYLNNGRARLEETHRDLMSVLRTRDTAAETGDASAASDGLSALYRNLNQHDPHYRYEFAVGDAANRDAYLPQTPPDTLIATAQISDGGTCVTWHVHARCDESLRERPIPVGVRFDPTGSPEFQEALRLFVEYGQPFEGPAAVSIDLPGGLGGDHDNGTIRIGPTADDAARSYILRMRIAGSADAAPSTARLLMRAPTVGSLGSRLTGEHDGGVRLRGPAQLRAGDHDHALPAARPDRQAGVVGHPRGGVPRGCAGSLAGGRGRARAIHAVRGRDGRAAARLGFGRAGRACVGAGGAARAARCAAAHIKGAARAGVRQGVDGRRARVAASRGDPSRRDGQRPSPRGADDRVGAAAGGAVGG